MKNQKRNGEGKTVRRPRRRDRDGRRRACGALRPIGTFYVKLAARTLSARSRFVVRVPYAPPADPLRPAGRHTAVRNTRGHVQLPFAQAERGSYRLSGVLPCRCIDNRARPLFPISPRKIAHRSLSLSLVVNRNFHRRYTSHILYTVT